MTDFEIDVKMYLAEIKFIIKKKKTYKDNIFKYIIGIKCKPEIKLKIHIKSHMTYIRII